MRVAPRAEAAYVKSRDEATGAMNPASKLRFCFAAAWVLACGDADPPPSAAKASGVGESVAESPFATIPDLASIHIEGELCGQANARTSALSSDKAVATTIFDSAALSYEGAPAMASCTIRIAMDVPSGYKVAMPLVVWRGYANRAVATRRYAYTGEQASQPFTKPLPEGNFTLGDKPELWSPTCGKGVQRVSFESTLEVSVASADDAFVLDSFDLNTLASAGVEWAHCDGTPVKTPPAEGHGDDGKGEPAQKPEAGAEHSALIPGAAGFEIDGELCGPALSWAVAFDDISQALGTVGFDQASLYYAGAAAAKSCTITVQLQVPNGFQLRMPSIVWHGFASNGVATRSYAYAGAATSSPLSEVLPETFTLSDSAELWSPTCGTTQQVRFISKLEAAVTGAGELVVVDDFTIDTRSKAGVEWRACGDEP